MNFTGEDAANAWSAIVTTGVVWDYLRLELNDGSKAYPAPPDNPRPDYPTLPATAGTTQAE